MLEVMSSLLEPAYYKLSAIHLLKKRGSFVAEAQRHRGQQVGSKGSLVAGVVN